MDKSTGFKTTPGIASTEARRQGALRLLRFAAALAGDSTPLLRLTGQR